MKLRFWRNLTWLDSLQLDSTFSDLIIIQSKIVIPAWIAGIQAPWMDLSLPWYFIFPTGEYDELAYNRNF